jgi:hypothetical protein
MFHDFTPWLINGEDNIRSHRAVSTNTYTIFPHDFDRAIDVLENKMISPERAKSHCGAALPA